MKTIRIKIQNQDGFILLLSMSILVVLTLIGVAAIRSSSIELKIAGNERKMSQEFYVVDGTWRIGGLWLQKFITPPDFVNIKANDNYPNGNEAYYDYVRNYGDGDDTFMNNAFPNANHDGTYLSTPFWYRVLYHSDTKAQAYGAGYRDFRYGAESTASGRTTIAARVYKIFKVGY